MAPKALSKEQGEKAIAWLTERGALRECPICGTNQWSVGSPIAMVPLYGVDNGEPSFYLGGGLPLVPIHCSKCAYVRFHNAISMGLAESDEALKAKKKSEASNV